jgi:error-prone DNA polymerase
MNRAFDILEADKGLHVELKDLQDDDPGVYAMIQKADTLGTFQIEPRPDEHAAAQRPQRFYDLVIQVAIVGPGRSRAIWSIPISADGRVLSAQYPRPELRAVLEKTLGVPLFQEQAMKVAIVSRVHAG